MYLILTFSFVTLIYCNNEKSMFLKPFAFKKHTYEYLPYNNLMDPRLAQDVLFNTICSMTTNDSERNAYLKSFKLITQIKMNPNASHQSYTFGG
jgi:hypothetical protein